jgi:hypothetical protein
MSSQNTALIERSAALVASTRCSTPLCTQTAARSGSDHSRQKRWLPSPRAWRQAIPFTCGGATRLPLHHHLGGGCGSSHPSLFRSNRSRCERLCQARPRLLRSQGTYISFQSRWQFQYKISHLLLKYKIDVVVFYPN